MNVTLRQPPSGENPPSEVAAYNFSRNPACHGPENREPLPARPQD